MVRFLVPLVIFGLMVGLFIFALDEDRDARELPSPLVGKPAPDFRLVELHNPGTTFDSQSMRGKVWLLNVWASWCVACRSEHPLFMEIARQKAVPIYGLNYKDGRQDALNWLKQLGNPYKTSASDFEGRVGINYGVYGVPESFLIDKVGVIRHKVIGPMSRAKWQQCVSPLVEFLQTAEAADAPVPKALEDACSKRL
jgi:cytochrome c biogenesis protein CcmG/thiol:disulfide interchange protein DsbE